jgi:hypothetical protein
MSCGARGAVLSAWVLPVWNVASWSAVRCIVRCVVSVGNVFRSGSSSEGHHSKRTLHNSVYLSAWLKLRGTNSTRNLPGGTWRPARKADNLIAICELIF